MNSDEARMIAQDFLDRQGDATLSGDLDATLAWCDIPCTLETMEHRIVAHNLEEMRAICASFIQQMKVREHTHMVRRCLEASFDGHDSLKAAYETRYVSKGARLEEGPYFGLVTLRRRATGWKISAMQFAATEESAVTATMRERR
ncbi:hypothetical protein AQS8620_02592 [Aquimixticola soesokkakensis]|uniref:SnoaL-like domain-containing protein n=1 Tax=Aquimixticola soesokkakensis TaxID=1519096 RepID=A0A1Y5TC04_9RHOB|nr:hypothetical protein [Aquimixticola soesokkakensis]SLN58467.1 hypothetical protein AQS8620_02592 [Aquimixticola soesokkakensis]